MQLHAGYQLDSVQTFLTTCDDDITWSEVSASLCAFWAIGECDLNPRSETDPLITVIDNLISRGLPTRPSCFVEEALAEMLGRTTANDSEVARRTGSIEYRFTEAGRHSEFQDLLRRAFAVIEPRLDPTCYRNVEHDSTYEADFYSDLMVDQIGPHAPQLLETQRSLESILRPTEYDRRKLRSKLDGGRGVADRFYRQRVDFAAEFPRSDSKEYRRNRGLIIEVDGQQHHEAVQSKLDRERMKQCRRVGWPTARISTSELLNGVSEKKIGIIADWFQHPYARLAAENYESPLWLSQAGREAMQLALTPLAVARLQKVLTRLILSETLDLKAERWRLAIIERDVPAAHLAIADYKRLLSHLFDLEGDGRSLPEIELRVYATDAFWGSTLNEAEEVHTFESREPFDADVCLDCSILQRRGVTGSETASWPEGLSAHCRVTIRSAHSISAPRQIMCARPLNYEVGNDEQPEPLVYLLQTIFRKRQFREGQVEILRRSLQREGVIALLPTGAGKSLTYQLSALLQPGITIVVDPIKSLMKDQHDSLQRQGIDATAYINSSLPDKKRAQVENRMEAGEFQYVFISPERFMIAGFRKRLERMGLASEFYVTYCVVDEAHCVSEWGHDFRTSYLRLGHNARTYCPTYGRADLPILALTGTASYAVLQDVRRELEFDREDEEAIITPSDYRRDELVFDVVEVPVPDPEGEDEWAMREQVAREKQRVLVKEINALPTRFTGLEDGDVPMEEAEQDDGDGSFFTPGEETSNAGIVFAPHKGWLFGVKDIVQEVRREIPALRGRADFYGGAERDGKGDFGEERLAEVQDRYREDDLTLLVATKAFGMGIDKPNIRYTVHFNMPPSIESFYQEAGRAGRDRALAHCLILYCNDVTLTRDSEKVTVDKDLMLSFHRNSFKGKDKEMRMLRDVMSERFRIVEVDDNNDRRTVELPSIWDQITSADTNGELSTQKHISFQNDQAASIRDHLAEVTGTGGNLQQGMVDEARAYCDNIDDFIDNLVHEVESRNWDKRWPNLGAKIRGARFDIEKSFQWIRDDEDTFKAVYRLSIIGVIKDYTLDYHGEVVEARVQRLTDEEYIQNLQKYLARYMAPEDVQRVPEEVRAKKEDTVIERCLARLLDFVYARIKAQRREAIDNMEKAVQEALAAEGEFPMPDGGVDRKEDRQSRFADRVYTFFDSKYTPDLREYLYDNYNVDLVWEYMERTAGAEANLKHLRGACDRLLESNPDNTAFLLMRAFSGIMLSEESTQRAQADLDRAWQHLRTQADLDWADFMDLVSRYCELVASYDQSKEADLVFSVKTLHNEWLKTFSERHLADLNHA